MLKNKYPNDEYLVPNSALRRLLNDYYKHGSIVVAYDYDNTVFDFHGKDEEYHQVIELLRRLKELGCTLIVWTANSELESIKQYLKENAIPYDLINENPDFVKEIDIRKIYYNILLDDRAGLDSTYRDLDMFCTIVNMNMPEVL